MDISLCIKNLYPGINTPIVALKKDIWHLIIKYRVFQYMFYFNKRDRSIWENMNLTKIIPNCHLLFRRQNFLYVNSSKLSLIISCVTKVIHIYIYIGFVVLSYNSISFAHHPRTDQFLKGVIWPRFNYVPYNSITENIHS